MGQEQGGAVKEPAPVFGNDFGDYSQQGLPDNFGLDPRSCTAGLPYEDIIERSGRDSKQSDPKQKFGKDCEAARKTFKPQFTQVIYMKFGENENEPSFTARHAYFRYGDPRASVACAIAYLAKGEASPGNGKDCRAFNNNRWGKIRRNFENLGYGSQQQIYVYVDNPNVSFNETAPITFTPWTAHQDQYNSNHIPPDELMNPNFSFGGAQVKRIPGTKYIGLYFENYFKNNIGGQIEPNDKTYYKYSINFNLLMCKNPDAVTKTCNFSDPSATIGIAIDPDTGNGRPRRP